MKRWYGFCGIGFSLCVGVGCVWEDGKGLGNWRCKRLNGHDDFNGYVGGGGGGKAFVGSKFV